MASGAAAGPDMTSEDNHSRCQTHYNRFGMSMQRFWLSLKSRTASLNEIGRLRHAWCRRILSTSSVAAWRTRLHFMNVTASYHMKLHWLWQHHNRYLVLNLMWLFVKVCVDRPPNLWNRAPAVDRVLGQLTNPLPYDNEIAMEIVEVDSVKALEHVSDRHEVAI